MSQVRCGSVTAGYYREMSIRQLFLVMGLAVSCCLPAGAQSVLAVTSTLSLAQALQAAQNNLEEAVFNFGQAARLARGDKTVAGHLERAKKELAARDPMPATTRAATSPTTAGLAPR